MKSRFRKHTVIKGLGVFALALIALLIPSLTAKSSGPAAADVITATSSLLEIAIPFDPAGKTDVKVYRYHGSGVDVLTDTANHDGEYIVLDENGITLHVRGVFPFAIGYKEVKGLDPPLASALGEGLAVGVTASAFVQERSRSLSEKPDRKSGKKAA